VPQLSVCAVPRPLLILMCLPQDPNTNVSVWNVNVMPVPNAVDNNLKEQDRCTIQRVREVDLTAEAFASEYWRKKPVILMREKGLQSVAQLHTEKEKLKEKLLTNFGDK
jgi:hypothetical protein